MNDIVTFKDEQLELEVNISPEEDTVWLSLDQLSDLFDKNKSTISRHIKNIFSEGELDSQVVVAKFATTTQHGAIAGKTQSHITSFYNLDVIISVGYRVKIASWRSFSQMGNQCIKAILNRRLRSQCKALSSFKQNSTDTVQHYRWPCWY